MIKIYAADGLLHCKWDLLKEKNLLKSLGFKFDRKKKTYAAPESYRAMLDIKETGFQYQMSEKPPTQEALQRMRDQFQYDKFLARYLSDLSSGKRTPDLTGHDFAEGIEPREHQKSVLDFIRITDDIALFWDCGLGKTFVICMWASYLKERIPGAKTLVIAPKSTLYPTWVDDMLKFTDLSVCVLDKGSAHSRKTLLKLWSRKSKNIDYDVYVIPFDSVKPVKLELEGMGFALLAIDESTFIKNHKANRSKAIVSVADSIPRTAIMAGLPAPNKTDDLFMQVRAMGPQYFGHDYYKFMNRFFHAIQIPMTSPNGKPFEFTKWEPREGAIDGIQSIIKKKGVRLKMSESGVKLPGSVPIVRDVMLSTETFTKLKQMSKDCIIYLKGAPLFSEGIAKFMRLREITSGFVIDADEQVHHFQKEPEKLEVIRELLEEEIGCDEDGAPKQVIIWAHFKQEYSDLKSKFGDRLRVLAEHNDRGRLLQDFKDNKFSYLVANPSSLGHGVTLTQCNYMVWYSFSYSSEQYYQANRRIARIGQTKTAIIYHLVAVGPKRESTVDNILLDSIQGKLTQNEKLLSVFRSKLEEQFGG